MDIILHSDEPDIDKSQPVVELKHLPAYILVKMKRTWASTLLGLNECVIPVEPTTVSYHIKMKQGNGKTYQRTVKQTQYPMTAGYTFTDYQ